MTPEEEADWLAWRKQGITASNVASDLTGKYGGAFAVVADKLGLDKPQVKKAQQSDYDRGHTWEAKLTKVVEAIAPFKVVGQGARIEWPTNRIHRCTPDGFLIDPETLEATGTPSVELCDALVEFKTVRSGQDWQWDYWRAQVQWQMHCADLDLALLVVAVTDHDNEGLAGGGIRPYWIERDDDMIAFLVELADAMWAQVQVGELPEPDTDSALPLVRWMTRFADKDATTVDLRDHADTLDRVCAIKDATSVSKKEREQKTAVLTKAMGAATKGETDTAYVTYSEPNAKGVRTFKPDWKSNA